MNSITIAGNITRDANLNTVSDTQVCNFGVADNQRVKGADVTTFFDCALWGARGASLAQYLTKGKAVTVVGTLTTEEKDGKTYLRVKVADIHLGARGESKPAAADEEVPF